MLNLQAILLTLCHSYIFAYSVFDCFLKKSSIFVELFTLQKQINKRSKYKAAKLFYPYQSSE